MIFRVVLSLALATLTLGCGSSPVVSVRLRNADNSPSGTNPLATVLSNVANGTSRGLYFQLYEMTACPGSIQDVLAQEPVRSVPDSASIGASPAATSFTMDLSGLPGDKAYALWVVAVGSGSAQITHRGYADCPIYPSDAGRQPIILCFNVEGINPDCSSVSTPFGSCRRPSVCN